MNESTQDTWKNGLTDEINFWRDWLTKDKYKQVRDLRLDKDRIFQLGYLVRDITENEVKVLDVGSGPLSTLGDKMNDRRIIITAVDPLAAEYNALLDELGMTELPRIVSGNGESLNEIFEENHFDIVFSTNALDHSYDPLLCIKNMMRVCKSGGTVIFLVKENEGERQNYNGLHQWNFELKNEDMRIWNRNNSFIMHEEIKFGRQPITEIIRNDSSGAPIIKAQILI
jgi:ubiquinone/menaquinone biosynthesis C-methylase UbiE